MVQDDWTENVQILYSIYELSTAVPEVPYLGLSSISSMARRVYGQGSVPEE